MRSFFKSTRFKVLLGVTAALLVVTVVMNVLGGWSSPQEGVAGAAAAPLQKLVSSVSGFFEKFGRNEALEQENAELREQVSRLASELIDYQKTLDENRFYREFLELKEEHDDFTLQPAQVISRDPDDQFGAFTIDRGSLQGVGPHDPVVTSEGLVGYVTSVAPTYSTVVTILSPELKAAAFDRRTRDSGILSGSALLVEDGLCRLDNLQRDCSVTVGDYIVTSGGGGIFPEGLLIGTVKEVRQDPSEILVHAIVEPSARLDSLRDVMVITSFEGQTELSDRVK